MSRVTALTVAELIGLPCPYCERRVPPGTSWLTAAQKTWGRCGIKLQINEQVCAVLVMAPGSRPGQAQIKMLWVHPDVVGLGLGRQLVHSAVAEAERMKLTQLVAVGGHNHPTCAAPPDGFLRETGFRRKPGESLWRLDLNQAVLERAGLGRLVRILRGWGQAGPEPAPGGVSGRTLPR